jgi:hypothetical protein
MRYKGYGFRRIATALNKAGIMTPRDHYYQRLDKPNPLRQNHLWNDKTIKLILRNEAYIGNLVQNKTGNLSYKNHKLIKKPKSDWVRVEATHEPIVTLEVWEQVCKIDNAPARPKRTGNGEINLFGGLVHWLDCGFAMRFQQEQHRRKSGDLVVYKSYSCGNYARSGKCACSSHIIYINRLAEIIVADIRQKAALIDCDEVELMQRVSQQKETASREQLSVLQSALKAAENRRTELERLVQSCYEDRVQGRIPVDVCSRLIAQYEAERREKCELARSLSERIGNFKTEQCNIGNGRRQFVNLLIFKPLTAI